MKSDQLPAMTNRIQPRLLTTHSSSVTLMSCFFSFFFFFSHSRSSLGPSVQITPCFPHLFESISEWMEEPAVSVAWFRAVWQKVTSSCSVRGGEGGMRREGWDGSEGGRGKGVEGERGKGRVNEYVYRKMSRQLSTTWSEHLYLYQV